LITDFFGGVSIVEMTDDYYPIKPQESPGTKKITRIVSNTVESTVSDNCKLTNEPKEVDFIFWAALSMIGLCLLYSIK
jgi:hypothetical protein